MRRIGALAWSLLVLVRHVCQGIPFLSQRYGDYKWIFPFLQSVEEGEFLMLGCLTRLHLCGRASLLLQGDRLAPVEPRPHGGKCGRHGCCDLGPVRDELLALIPHPLRQPAALVQHFHAIFGRAF